MPNEIIPYLEMCGRENASLQRGMNFGLAKDCGRAGCEFVQVPPVDLTILPDWLKSKIQIKKPLIAI